MRCNAKKNAQPSYASMERNQFKSVHQRIGFQAAGAQTARDSHPEKEQRRSRRSGSSVRSEIPTIGMVTYAQIIGSGMQVGTTATRMTTMGGNVNLVCMGSMTAMGCMGCSCNVDLVSIRISMRTYASSSCNGIETNGGVVDNADGR